VVTVLPFCDKIDCRLLGRAKLSSLRFDFHALIESQTCTKINSEFDIHAHFEMKQAQKIKISQLHFTEEYRLGEFKPHAKMG